jgi:hypothetical protein
MITPVTERILSTRELNRALLARQLLLERSAIPLTRALERVAGLQTQYAPSGYIGLWSRLRDFDRNALTKALEQRRAVQATLMRSTIHMVSAADFWLFAAGIRSDLREWFLRIGRHQVGREHMEQAAVILRERLAKGPCRATELRQLLDAGGVPAIAWGGLGHWLDMVRVPPSGTWEQRRADLYGLAEDWLGKPTASATQTEGLTHLVRRYLGGFGPATVKEIVDWVGVPVTKLKPIVERLSLRRFRDEKGGQLLDLPNAPLPDPETPAPIRFLPTWDATLLVHARRTQILPEVYRPRVFNTKTPHSVPTFLVDGQVAGTWRYERGRVLLEPFDSIPRAFRRELDDETKALAAFHAD